VLNAIYLLVKFVFLIWSLSSWTPDGDLGKGLEDGECGELFFLFAGKLLSPGSYYDPRLKTPLVPVHLPRTRGLLSLGISPGWT
jgi:hypothetical protein